MKNPFAVFVQPVAVLLIPGKLLWPYFAGAVVLVIGLAWAIRGQSREVRGIDRAIVFGPLFLALPMAVFGADHFVFPAVVAAAVPAWIPGHMFWVYFVGVANIAAALSIATKRHSVLAATLLSAMLFSFVLLIHVPNFFKDPLDRINFAVLLRDLSFSAGALAYAVVQAGEWSKRHVNGITTLLRCAFAIPAIVFGIEHFLHPQFVPVVPLKMLLPSWIPAHLLLNYLTGAVLIAGGLCLLSSWKARQAAAWVGVFVFAIVLLVYLPILLANLSDIGSGLNYFADTLAYGGAALLVAGALPAEHRAEVTLKSREGAVAGVGPL
jgi:uncharacterized membrane protein